MQNFYRDLQQPVRLSDAQLEELRSRILKGVLPQIQAQADAISETAQNASDLTSFVTGIEGTTPPVDDGLPITPPQHLVLTPVPYHELDASWDAPLQHIAKSVAEVTPSGGSPFTVEGTALGVAATNLAAVSTSVRVKLVNAWGRESAYCAPQTATPLITAAEQINFNTLTLGTTLQGLLPNGALAQITDPGLLADNAVKAVANAANKNILPYIESQPNHYDAGAWATVGPGKQTYNNASTSIVVDSNGVKQWQVTATATDGWSEAFAASDYGQKISNWYIYSVQCSNPSGTAHSGKVSVVFYDSLGNAIGETVGSYTSIPGNGSVQIYVNFQIPGGTSSIRFKRWVQTVGTSLNFTNAMLEEVPITTTTPSAYTVPAMFTGILGANTVAALDVLGVNAVFKTASITNAVIANITADKILTGSITTETITLALSGKMQAGSTIFDTHGVTLPVEVGYSTPSLNRDYKISASDHASSMSFYLSDDLTAGVPRSKGVVIRADGGIATGGGGVSGQVPGEVVLQATRNGVLSDPNTMLVEFQADLSSYPNAFYFCNILMGTGYEIFPDAYTGPFSMGAGATTVWTFGNPFPAGQPPRMVHGFYVGTPGTWNPMYISAYGGGNPIYIQQISSTNLTTINQRTSAVTIYWSAWQ